MRTKRVRRIGFFVFLFSWMAVFGFASIGSRASILTDIPQALNNVLFDGGNIYAAQLVLTAGIMMSAGLALAALRHLSNAGMFIVLFCVLGSLSAIGWADISFVIVAIFVAVGMFGSSVVKWVKGSYGD